MDRRAKQNRYNCINLSSVLKTIIRSTNTSDGFINGYCLTFKGQPLTLMCFTDKRFFEITENNNQQLIHQRYCLSHLHLKKHLIQSQRFTSSFTSSYYHRLLPSSRSSVFCKNRHQCNLIWFLEQLSARTLQKHRIRSII